MLCLYEHGIINRSSIAKGMVYTKMVNNVSLFPNSVWEHTYIINSVCMRNGVLQSMQKIIKTIEKLCVLSVSVAKYSSLRAGNYTSEAWGKDYPRIQILTIEQLFSGEKIKMPEDLPQFKKAKRVSNSKKENGLFEK